AELVEFFVPLHSALESPAGLRDLLSRLGWDVSDADLATILESLASTGQQIGTVIDLLEDKTDSGQELDEQDYALIASTAAQVFDVLRDLAETIPDLRVGPGSFTELFDLLLADYLRLRLPAAFRA